MNKLLIILCLMLVPLASGGLELGDISSEKIVSIETPEPPLNESNLSVGEANLWNTTSHGPLSDANDTQFDAVGGVLTIDESWLTSVINFILGTFNPFDQVLNTTSNVTFNNLTVTQNISEGGQNLEDKYQRKVNPGNMLMGFVDDRFFMRIS